MRHFRQLKPVWLRLRQTFFLLKQNSFCLRKMSSLLRMKLTRLWPSLRNRNSNFKQLTTMTIRRKLKRTSLKRQPTSKLQKRTFRQRTTRSQQLRTDLKPLGEDSRMLMNYWQMKSKLLLRQQPKQLKQQLKQQQKQPRKILLPESLKKLSLKLSSVKKPRRLSLTLRRLLSTLLTMLPRLLKMQLKQRYWLRKRSAPMMRQPPQRTQPKLPQQLKRRLLPLRPLW